MLDGIRLTIHDKYFNPWPVLNKTIRSSGSTSPASTNISSPARVAAPSGQAKIPSVLANSASEAAI